MSLEKATWPVLTMYTLVVLGFCACRITFMRDQTMELSRLEGPSPTRRRFAEVFMICVEARTLNGFKKAAEAGIEAKALEKVKFVSL